MGSPFIFSGNDSKSLKPNLDLNGNVKILSGATNPTAVAVNAPAGSIYLNTSNGYTYRKIDAGLSTNWLTVGNANNFSVQNFSGDGTTTAFTLSTDPGTENNTIVTVEAVYQQKNTYSISGTTLTFSSPPPAGTDNIEVCYGTILDVGVPGDGTVSAAKMQANAVATTTIQDGAVTKAKLASLGQQISASSETFSTTSTSRVDVTNLSVTITTTGRPVFIGVIMDGSSNMGSLAFHRQTQSHEIYIYLMRDSTDIYFKRESVYSLGSTQVTGTFGAPYTIDLPAAGTYTYKIQVMNFSSGNTPFLEFRWAKLIAYEL